VTLILHGVALNEEPLTRPLVGRFDERGGTLGRSDNATFTLPDPERMISRIQAQVLHRDEGYWVESVSAASPILHNGRPLSAGMRVMLREGDELRIGGYTLRAAFEDDEASASILRGRTLIQSPKGARAAPPAAPLSTEPAPPPADAPPPAGAARRAPSNRPADAAAQPGAGSEALWRSFLSGAALELPYTAPSTELLSSVGAMMRIAIEGIHRLVAMRATAKNELRAEMTTIQVRGNNPLKFAPDATVALRLLLQPPARGFLAGPAALREALIDLQSHEVGVIAGMRAALEAVLERFDPTMLENLLSTRSMFDSLRPGRRNARLWDLYLQHYRSLREEAQEDFQRFFGEAFRDAYEAQVRNLDSAHTDGVATGPEREGGG
jgi:predicted component of type VI protein secretion system